jgi:hypothetical protein
MSGALFDAGVITVEPQSFRMIDLQEWVTLAGPEFRQGSIQVFHRGRDLVLGSQIYLIDERHSLSFDEKLVEAASFKSSRMDGLWWLPSPKGQVQLVLSNTSSAPVTTIVGVSGKAPQKNGSQAVPLGPHETRLLNLQEDVLQRDRGAMSRFGAISVQHSGSPGAVIARGMCRDESNGFSLTIQFSDPLTGKSQSLQGAGLRLGSAGNDSLKAIVIAKNVGGTTTTISGRLRYPRIDGTAELVSLQPLHLAPNDFDVLDVSQALREAGNPNVEGAGGLEFEYSTIPGSVTMTAFSVGDRGNQVFRVPMWDIAAQRSATGGYPWHVEGNSSTVVYIKNTEQHGQHFYFELRYTGGIYSLGIKTIEPGQTVTLDVRNLRDKQVPDAKGRVIPQTAEAGQIHWSKTGNEPGMLIGRSEQVDLNMGISNNYACVNCCPDNSVNPRVREDTSCAVGENRLFIAEEQLTTCYGWNTDYMEVFDATWTSSDVSVADVTAGNAFAQAPGVTQIEAQWQSPRYTFVNDAPPGPGGIEPIGGQGSCEATSTVQRQGQATLTVTPAVGSIKAEVPSTGGGDPGAFSSTSPSILFADAQTTLMDMMVVLQSSSGLITVSAEDVNPTSSTNQLRWKIDRDPTDTVATGTPSLSAQTGSPITVTPNTAGNFRLICYYDKNGNAAYDTGEEKRVIRMAVVRITKSPSDVPEIGALLQQTGATNGVNTGSAMAISLDFLLEGGGNNRMIGVKFVHIGNVGNLTADNSVINFPIPVPTPPAPGNVAGTEFEIPGATLPMLDGPNDNPTGGDQAFRSASTESSSNGTGGLGQIRSVRSDDAPSFGPWDATHPVTHNPWMTTQGGYSFTEFMVAFSDSFKKYYGALAKATWTITAVGSRVSGVWQNTASGMTLQGASGDEAEFTSLISNGSPQSGDTAGVKVLGLSYVNHFSYGHSP